MSQAHAGLRHALREHGVTAMAELLTGSVATGHTRANSDIDYLVLTREEPDAFYRVVSAFEGKKYDVCVIGVERIDALLERAVENAQPILLQILVDGVVLSDPSGALRSAVGKAARVFRDDRAPGSGTLDRCRDVAGELLDDLADAADPAEELIVGLELALATVNLRLLDATGWLGRGKWAARDLSTAGDAFLDDLRAGVHDMLTGAGRATLLNVAKRQLDDLGGRLEAPFRIEMS